MYLSSVSSRLLLHDVNTWDLKKSYGCYDGILRDISWSDDSKYILQVNSKGLVEILSPADHDVRSLQHVPLKDTWSASFHRDGHRSVAIGTKYGNVMIWDTKNKTITKTFPTPAQQYSVDHVSYNAKNTSLATTMRNGDTIIYGLVSNIPILTVKLACSKSISAMKFHHESRSLLGLATDEGHVVLRDITTNKDKVFFEHVHAAPVSDFVYSLINRDVMLSCGFDKVMHVYDVRLQNVVSTIRTSNTLTSLSLNVENLVALGSKSGSVLVYDLRDLNNPLRILKGHEEEVRKVAFQPVRKKTYSTEVSLRDETEVMQSPPKVTTPIRNRTSDVYYVADTPPGMNLDVPTQGESRADSFLVMMGLDKSNNLLDDDNNKSDSYDKKSDQYESYNNHPDTEKNLTKVSTPKNNNMVDFAFPSPIYPTINMTDDNKKPDNVNGSNGHVGGDGTKIDSKAFDDLKDFIKLSISDVADDNRNYFLHIMMAMTKQKLYMEKKLTAMHEKIIDLTENQHALIEYNRKLAIELGSLRSHSEKEYYRI